MVLNNKQLLSILTHTLYIHIHTYVLKLDQKLYNQSSKTQSTF